MLFYWVLNELFRRGTTRASCRQATPLRNDEDFGAFARPAFHPDAGCRREVRWRCRLHTSQCEIPEQKGSLTAKLFSGLRLRGVDIVTAWEDGRAIESA